MLHTVTFNPNDTLVLFVSTPYSAIQQHCLLLNMNIIDFEIKGNFCPGATIPKEKMQN